MAETQVCPRRMEGYPYAAGMDGPDEWRGQGGIIGQEKIGLGCSYCGSLHPDRFMELVREGCVVGPTDKSYKAYLRAPVSDDEKARRKTAWMDGARGGANVASAIRDLGMKDGKSQERITADLEDHWAKIEAPLADGGTLEAKFYYQHLSDDQKREFIDLWNAKRMRVGYPGHFYRLPFFMTYADADG